MSEDEMRYGFGKNWAEFIEKRFSEQIIEDSKRHLARVLRRDSLKGMSFLDIGCGSGLHSIAALRLGADSVYAFDYDKDSVATAKKIREMTGGHANWYIEQGSVLDADYMARLPKSDIVYSWGVLHHTGSMWESVRNAGIPMKPTSDFYIALYSSDNYVDPTPEYWIALKREYNLAGALKKRLMEWQYAWRFHIGPELKAGRNPLQIIRNYGDRGMTYWTDVKDWLGGYPMEFASLQETQDFCRKELGLDLVNVKTGEGCTEYVFCNLAQNAHWNAVEKARVRKPLGGPFVHQGGAGYAVVREDLQSWSNANEAPRRSGMMIYEDGKMLGLAHSLVDHMVRFGHGRFNHWGPNVYLSAIDNSDPNTNGRSYSYCEDY